MVILKDVDFEDLETVVKFIYHGIVNVSSDKLPAVLNTADALQIKGLEKTNELMASVLSSSTHSSQVGFLCQFSKRTQVQKVFKMLKIVNLTASPSPHHVRIKVKFCSS